MNTKIPHHERKLLTSSEAYSSSKILKVLGRICRDLDSPSMVEGLVRTVKNADWESSDKDSLRWQITSGTVDEVELYVRTKILMQTIK